MCKDSEITRQLEVCKGLSVFEMLIANSETMRKFCDSIVHAVSFVFNSGFGLILPSSIQEQCAFSFVQCSQTPSQYFVTNGKSINLQND